jgi:DivIVA domain-containing protein
MELTPKVFRDVQFREKARGGYHPEDVDEFLEQAALGAEVLSDRLREAADRLLAAARAQASALVADAEERGRRAYDDSLADSQSKLEAAAKTLRQAEQEVEALRGWVDVNRSHLLAVMRDAQGLIENAGLLSEPPQASQLEAATVQAPAAGPAEEAAPASSVEEGEDLSLEEDNAPTGEWDARLLEEAGREAPVQATVTPGDGADQENQAAGGNSLHAATSASADDVDEGVHASPGDQTMAFDERALDSFFNEQDLGDERGPGRFRRRQ